MPTGIYKREYNKIYTKERNRKISKALKGKKKLPLSEEWKRKISEKLKGENNPFYGKTHSDKTKKNISEKQKGQHHSIRTEFKKGQLSVNKGKKIFKNSIAKIGEKNPNWRGGISFEPYSIDWKETLKKSIRERDKYICKVCNLYGFIVHHIFYDKKDCNPEHLITLCKKCHAKTNFNRDYWIKYFTILNKE
jgi:hypothetical protein